MLLDAVAAARPDAVMLETYPFGRVKFWPEIDSLIAAVRAGSPRAPVIASVRDIVVVGDKPERRRAIIERVRHHVDTVLVHGDPNFIPLEASFPETPQIRDRLVYTGYVADGATAVAEPAGADGRGEVLVSAGGGATGGPLLRAAIAARRAGCLGDSVWRVLTGPNLPAVEFAQLAADLPEGVVLERYRTDFPERLRRCRASVSQGGYNTTLDILARGAPAVIVPFADHEETEQRLRTERLTARGFVEMVDEAELSPAALAAALARAVERGAKRDAGDLGLDFGGAEFTARFVATAHSGRRDDEP
jgi:predicted glycosyltransferase